ncbi:hypothetical protein ACIQMV_32370 [Streptomyces sp. NPDC091412]|uniref:hypothetical protein n=1 Tax=Streptomyces sp. NPDC091412 TaxID=3366002 RepID=UPI003826FBEC
MTHSVCGEDGEQDEGGRALFRCPPGQSGSAAVGIAGEERWIDVAHQVGADHAGHDGIDGNAVTGPAAGGFDGEQGIGRHGLPVSGLRGVGALLVVDVVDDDG